MNPYIEFMEFYLHYTVSYKLFLDICRQIRDSKGSVEERQKLVDESLRIALTVIDNINEVEARLGGAVESIQSGDAEASEDMLDAISYIPNNLKEERARVDEYSRYITAKRLSGTERKPRKPQVANPFMPIAEARDYEEDEDEEVQMVTIPTDDEVTEDVTEGNGRSVAVAGNVNGPVVTEENPLIRESRQMMEDTPPSNNDGKHHVKFSLFKKS